MVFVLYYFFSFFRRSNLITMAPRQLQPQHTPLGKANRNYYLTVYYNMKSIGKGDHYQIQV